MEGVLDGGSLTVLAPTNGAIDSMPDSQAILTDPTAAEALVNSHLVSGQLDSVAIFASSSLQTVDGDALSVDGVARTITGPSRAAATIVMPDQHGTNGYVHSISAVLDIPTAPPPPTPPTEAPAPAPPNSSTTPA